MKRLYLPLLIVSLLACSGGGSDPIEPDPVQNNAPKVTSGMFDVTAVQTFNECDQSTVWAGEYAVDIDSLSFAMGPFVGKWDPAKASAAADGEKDVTVTRSCTATRWASIYVTFSSPDKFTGTILYRLRLRGDCGTRPTCTTSWIITGTRQADAEP